MKLMLLGRWWIPGRITGEKMAKNADITSKADGGGAPVGGLAASQDYPAHGTFAPCTGRET